MSKTKMTPKSKVNGSRRKFITQVGAGLTSVAMLSSCELEDLNIIGKLKRKTSGKPSDAEVAKFLEVIEVEANLLKITNRMKRNVGSLPGVTDNIKSLFSEQKIRTLIDAELAFYSNFYKQNYTAAELSDLTKILNSKLWKKYTSDLQEAGSANETLAQRPSIKFTNQVNELIRGLAFNKSSRVSHGS